MSRLSVYLCATLLVWATPARPTELPSPVSVSHTGDQVRGPIAWEDFCNRYPSECGRVEVPQTIHLNRQTWAVVQAVNRQVNGEIEPVTDAEHWGTVDQWDYPLDGRGDCEDYALLKRRRLIDLGWPASALLITVVRMPNGEGHAVLTVVTDRGDFILNNLTDEIGGAEQAEFTLVKRQSARNGREWARLDGFSPVLVASTGDSAPPTAKPASSGKRHE